MQEKGWEAGRRTRQDAGSTSPEEQQGMRLSRCWQGLEVPLLRGQPGRRPVMKGRGAFREGLRDCRRELTSASRVGVRGGSAGGSFEEEARLFPLEPYE